MLDHSWLTDFVRELYDGPLPDDVETETPRRWQKAMRELTKGTKIDPGEILAKRFAAPGDDSGMVVLRRIPFVSLCEHHMLPFTGIASVGYIPTKQVVGLSKLARLVDCFANRLQIQERLTMQIVSALDEHLDPLGSGAIIEAEHSCMSCRGVKKSGASMITSHLSGAMRERDARAEFLGLHQH